MQENQDSEQPNGVEAFLRDVVQTLEANPIGTVEQKVELLLNTLSQKGYGLMTGEHQEKIQALNKKQEELSGELMAMLREQIEMQKGYIEKLEDKLGIPHIVDTNLTISR